MSECLPMFPLGSVLVPNMLLPLRVFEPRYLRLLEDVGEHGEFGVVLIERGFEVGGGDTRFGTGCVAQILDKTPLDEGHMLVVAAGVQRLRVMEWLPEDPYPRAVVSRLVDDPPAEPLAGDIAQLAQLLRRSEGLMAELGYDVGADHPEVVDDPVVAAYQGMMQAPLATLDRQRLLELNGAKERLRAVIAAVEGQIELLQGQLAAG